MTALDTKALLTGVTPGPWVFQPCEVTGQRFIVAGAYPYGNDICAVEEMDGDANARLIAAAPSLARRVIALEEALRMARDVFVRFHQYTPRGPVLTQIDAALTNKDEA